jgi:predicted O-methyltransferase YrrM
MSIDYKYTQDWTTLEVPTWSKTLVPLFSGKETHAIELGAFEGRSTVWLMENVLTHPKSTIDCVDLWNGGNDPRYVKLVDWNGGEANFKHNTEPFGDKVRSFKESTFDYMKHRTEPADLIYVDAGHMASECLIDAVQSHLLLKPGGVIIFDDYLWSRLESNPVTPKPAIDAFITCFCLEYELIAMGYQVILQKKVVQYNHR